VLANVGLTGRRFTAKYIDQVTEMSREFLKYMKSLRVQAPEAINPVRVEKDNGDADAEPEPEDDLGSAWRIKMTAEGYPILPTIVMNKEISKAMGERLMREYITQHYCRFIVLMQLRPGFMTFRSGHWEKE
jgi:hypothetical protein